LSQKPLLKFDDDLKQELPAIPPAKDGMLPGEWLGNVHPDGFLELTRGFYLYADKVHRALRYLAHERREDKSLYEQIAQATGMSAVQVEAYMQYATAMQLLVSRSLRLTPLTQLILQHDPFFDQPGTLWLLHYLFASDPTRVVWNYMCNSILPAVPIISKVEAAEQFLPFSGRWSETSLRKKVRTELGAFFANYTTEFFAKLDYLRETEKNVYTVNRHVMPVPPTILLSTILVYRDRFSPGASSVEIPTLAHAGHSPGRLLRQSELNIRQTLNELHEAGWLTIEAKANLDQVRFRTGITWLDAARAYWEAGP
jgi:hypothetical protein